MLFMGAPISTSRLRQLVCFLPVGVLNLIMFIWIFSYHFFVNIGTEKPQWEVSNYEYILMAGFGGFSLTFAGLILWYVCNLSFLSLPSK